MAPKKSPPKRGGGAPLGAKSLWCPRVPCEDPRRAPPRRATSGDILWPPSAGFSPVAQARRSFARLTRRPSHSSAGGRSGNPRGRNASSWRGGPGRAGMYVRDEPICPAPSSGAVPRPAIKTPHERAPQTDEVMHCTAGFRGGDKVRRILCPTDHQACEPADDIWKEKGGRHDDPCREARVQELNTGQCDQSDNPLAHDEADGLWIHRLCLCCQFDQSSRERCHEDHQHPCCETADGEGVCSVEHKGNRAGDGSGDDDGLHHPTARCAPMSANSHAEIIHAIAGYATEGCL
jgi:hypothetical protein